MDNATAVDTTSTTSTRRGVLLRRLIRPVLALGAALIAVLSLTSPSHAINQIDDHANYGGGTTFSVDYQGTRTVTVAAWIADRPGDAYCTSAVVDILDANWNQIGQRVPLGSVCGGRTGFVERTITVTRDLAVVYNAIGGNSSYCLRASDGHFCQ